MTALRLVGQFIVIAALFAGVVTLDLEHLAGVLEVDATSRSARIGAGMRGPDLEAALAQRRPLSAHYRRWQRAWEGLGYPAFAAMLAVFFLMVNKPSW